MALLKLMNLITSNIESHRNSKNLFYRLLLFLKDTISNNRKTPFVRIILDILRKTSMKRLDNTIIPKKKSEIRLFMVVRNASKMLPFVFKYYRTMGVDRFFIVDNDSTDSTISFLLSQKNTHVFSTKEKYSANNFGIDWMEILLKKYGVGHWCLLMDHDELFIYPYCETVSLKKLCTFLDNEGSTGVFSLVIDMYSKKSTQLASYTPGQDLSKIFPYFDGDISSDAFDISNVRIPKERVLDKYGKRIPKQELYGGMRRRVFGVNAIIVKCPLIKYTPALSVEAGQHRVIGTKLSSIEGGLLHFKFSSSVNNYLKEEIKRKEHWEKGRFQRQIYHLLKKDPNLSLYYVGSVKYINSKQLLKKGMIISTKEFDNYSKLKTTTKRNRRASENYAKD